MQAPSSCSANNPRGLHLRSLRKRSLSTAVSWPCAFDPVIAAASILRDDMALLTRTSVDNVRRGENKHTLEARTDAAGGALLDVRDFITIGGLCDQGLTMGTGGTSLARRNGTRRPDDKAPVAGRPRLVARGQLEGPMSRTTTSTWRAGR